MNILSLPFDLSLRSSAAVSLYISATLLVVLVFVIFAIRDRHVSGNYGPL
jgi:hypothetical protein